MEPAILNSMIAIFSLTAILVMIFFGYFLGSEETRWTSKIGHGLIAIGALVLLLVFILKENPTQLESMILFTIAISSGMVMTAKDLTGGPVPGWISTVHGLLEGGGFTYLFVITYLNQG